METPARLLQIEEENAANELLAETLPQHDMNLPFNISDVTKLVNNAKKGKAPGLDSLIYVKTISSDYGRDTLNRGFTAIDSPEGCSLSQPPSWIWLGPH